MRLSVATGDTLHISGRTQRARKQPIAVYGARWTDRTPERCVFSNGWWQNRGRGSARSLLAMIRSHPICYKNRPVRRLDVGLREILMELQEDMETPWALLLSCNATECILNIALAKS
eukprot:gene19284-biopygen16036